MVWQHARFWYQVCTCKRWIPLAQYQLKVQTMHLIFRCDTSS